MVSFYSSVASDTQFPIFKNEWNCRLFMMKKYFKHVVLTFISRVHKYGWGVVMDP